MRTERNWAKLRLKVKKSVRKLTRFSIGKPEGYSKVRSPYNL